MHSLPESSWEWEWETVAGPFSFTEGPVWDGERVVFTDVPTSRILTFDPRTGETVVLLDDTEKAVGLALDADGRLYGCVDGGRRIERYEADGSRTVVADRFEGARLNAPNDLTIGADGRIWFSDPRYHPDKSVMELDHESVLIAVPDGDGYLVERATFDTTRPNGVLLSHDERTLYVAQTHMPPPESCRELRAYPIGDDGNLGDYEVLFDFGDDRGVDGMTLAPDGSLLAACGWPKGGRGPRVAVFAPDHTHVLDIPTVVNPSNLCFGGATGRDLYLTDSAGCLRRITNLLNEDLSSPW
ncbi:SMP-30/gluconolactonase/LRE family protein [Candidatus Poriferisodalis sp.]|uniref:SMP-30/gluconolactonase/LRE family protein n=1 Tax=Candidatus Poriferisodalis sp. TaxID=3101277 RepID=UPI003B02721D